MAVQHNLEETMCAYVAVHCVIKAVGSFQLHKNMDLISPREIRKMYHTVFISSLDKILWKVLWA